MAGEWIAFDLGLPDKPEVQELIDETGQPVEVVVFRLLRLWGWAAMNTTDGRARMTLGRLVRTCGADEPFWRAVAAVGWLEIDETAATVAIPRWDRRFSQAAKARRDVAERVKDHRDRKSRAGIGYLTLDQREVVVRRFGGRCVYCGIKKGQALAGGRRAEMHVDHLVPVACGGTNDAENLVCACKRCNLEKGDRSLAEWGCEPRFLPEGASLARGEDGSVTGVTFDVTQRVTQIRYQRRGEERREEVPPPPREAAQGEAADADPPAWEAFRNSWNAKASAGNRKEWKLADPPDDWAERIAEPGWYDQALEAIARLPKCRFFDSPVPLSQFLLRKFVPLCLGGQYDSPKAAKAAGGPSAGDQRAVVGWSGDDAARFEATKAALVARLRVEAGKDGSA